MLKLAVPNKGALAESAAEMLREAGYRGRRDSKELVVADPDNGVELYFLRPRDIAVYVGSGTLEAGITGRDLLLDSGSPATEVLPLGFGQSTFRYAARPGAAAGIDELAGRRVATSFPGLVRADLAKRGIDDHAGRGRRHRRRRRDRHHPAQRRAGGLRRPDPHQRGGADPAGRRG